MREISVSAAAADESVSGIGTEILNRARTRIEPMYRSIVDGLPDTLRHVGGYHIGWWEADGSRRADMGKAVRPALVLASSAAMGNGSGDEATDVAVAAAVAVELVHDFTLLHDDVMDGDSIRRHRPTAGMQFGIGPAILTGDIFLTAAIELLLAQDVNAAPALVRALYALCEGQSSDLAFEQLPSVDMDSCLRMAENKTGALFGAACELGALAAGAAPDRVRSMNRFGRQLGVAFQLVDDLLGIWGDPETTGKPVYSDLVRRKKSLPVVAALSSDTRAGRELMQLYMGSEELESDQLAHIALLIEQAGGRRWAETQWVQACEAAKRLLYSAGPEPSAAADLNALITVITRRDH